MAIQRIDQELAHEMMQTEKDVVIVDVRTPEEYAEGHIPGAVLLTNEEINAETAAAALPDRTKKLLVYCRSGRRSAQAVQKLDALGYEQVLDFGAILDWEYEIEE